MYPAFSGIPNIGEQSQKWLPHPCLLGGPKEGGFATETLHSRGSPTKGNKIRSGCLTPAFSGDQKRAVSLSNPCDLRDPQQRGQNHKWIPHPCLLGGPQVGGIATEPLHSWGSPTQGTKSEVAVSLLPFRGSTREQNCYNTLAFSGIPNKVEQNENCLAHACLL